jgi:hypothetical protein
MQYKKPNDKAPNWAEKNGRKLVSSGSDFSTRPNHLRAAASSSKLTIDKK